MPTSTHHGLRDGTPPSPSTSSSSSESCGDDESAIDPLEQLTAMGFSGGEAVDALLKCDGNVEQAALRLSEGGGYGYGGKEKGKSKSKKRGGKKKNKKIVSDDGGGYSGVADIKDFNAEVDVDVDTNDRPAENSNSEPNSKSNSRAYQQQKKDDVKFQKALRRKQKTCRVCGGPHDRKQCPGILDDGRGVSRIRDKVARKRDAKERKAAQQQQERNEELLSMGEWTAGVPYVDGFADVQIMFDATNGRKGMHRSGRASSISIGVSDVDEEDLDAISKLNKESFLSYLGAWASRTAVLGDNPNSPLTRDQQRDELRQCSGKELKERAFAALDGDAAQVEEALKTPNPRSALMDCILSGVVDGRSSDINTDPTRTLEREWPGFQCFVTPLSVIDGILDESMHQLSKKDTSNGVRILAAIPPADVAKHMMVPQEKGGKEVETPVDVSFLLERFSEADQTEAKYNHARALLLAAGKNKNRASAQAEVTRLKKLMAAQKAQQEEMKEVISEASSKAILSAQVINSMDLAVSDCNGKNGIVGVSCGLHYDTVEAKHPMFGQVVRAAQRAACEYAISTAVRASLPIVLECHDAIYLVPSEDIGDQPPMDTASAVLVRILVRLAPAAAVIILRNGSLTIAEKPGLVSLLQAFPKLYVGFSASLSYSKAPKALLDAAFDVPLDRIVLTSEAPLCLPPVMSSAPHLFSMGLPPHVACVAEAVSIARNQTASREDVLRESTKTLAGIFGLTTALANAAAAAASASSDAAKEP